MSAESQRTRDHFQEQGYLVANVEQVKMWEDRDKPKCVGCGHHPMIVRYADLFGVFDLLAMHPGCRESASGRAPDIILIQSTSETNHWGRRNKVLASMEAKLVLLAGVRVLVQSWRKNKDTNRWRPYDEWITLKDFRQAFAYPNDVRGLLEVKRKLKKPDLPKGATLWNPSEDEVPF